MDLKFEFKPYATPDYVGIAIQIIKLYCAINNVVFNEIQAKEAATDVVNKMDLDEMDDDQIVKTLSTVYNNLSN